MNRMRYAASALLLALALAVGGCEMMRDVFSLQAGLMREFDTRSISTNLTSDTLFTVTLHNSALGALPEPARSEKAREVAVYVRDHYKGYGELKRVSVAFAQRDGAGVASMTTSEAYTFYPADLGTSERR